MADKIEKFLAKLSGRELLSVQAAIIDILNKDLAHLDVKPLAGSRGTYRVRKGRIRIIFRMRNEEVKILAVANRDDKTYRNI